MGPESGDWMFTDRGLCRKREVIAIAGVTGRSRHEVAGLMLEFWAWAEGETVDGRVDGVVDAQLSTLIGADAQFWRAVRDVGWLRTTEDGHGIIIPNFERWMGRGTKARKLKTLRQKRYRDSDENVDARVDGQASTRASTRREENRREESIEEDTPSECCPEPAEPASEPPPSSPVVMVFPTVGNGRSGWPLTEAKVTEYRQTYPGVDVPAECRRAWQWCQDNPTRRKTVKGMPAFLARWLGKAQDRGPPLASGGKAASLKGMFEDLP